MRWDHVHHQAKASPQGCQSQSFDLAVIKPDDGRFERLSSSGIVIQHQLITLKLFRVQVAARMKRPRSEI
jgi:hypothetical protein